MTHPTHWFCAACGTFDGPLSGQCCDVCSDGSEVDRLIPKDVVLAVVLDALSWMSPDTAERWRAESSYKRLAEMLP